MAGSLEALYHVFHKIQLLISNEPVMLSVFDFQQLCLMLYFGFDEPLHGCYD